MDDLKITPSFCTISRKGKRLSLVIPSDGNMLKGKSVKNPKKLLNFQKKCVCVCAFVCEEGSLNWLVDIL